MSHALAISTGLSRIEAETPADAQGVETLVMAAFGPGRFAKTAERLREGSAPSAGFVAHAEGRVIGSVRLWPVTVAETPALFLGPIAVDAGRRSDGLGAELVAACLDHARTLAGQVGGVLLVGDRAYFERFGFIPAPDVVLPGPVDRRRILWLTTGVTNLSGAVAIAR
ncbi:MAG: N-acetyltransferase [Candidatus Brevundimonas colombiensis]|uniref:N-acetyltransferase n=1 Tax=Candidatus Brevundimonas colombiensis TaxID=3121376 RepID=A0AAJ5X420_9CAUL|nr:N-acetyltransferase [Brevundimonas sp.]WEK39915.1 MAG: N-acetyltransferase [Brevundimonas sp.]